MKNLTRKNIGLVIIDGVADLCSDVNNLWRNLILKYKNLMEWTE